MASASGCCSACPRGSLDGATCAGGKAPTAGALLGASTAPRAAQRRAFSCVAAAAPQLPTIQSAIYAAILLSTASFVPATGYLTDRFGGYQLPLLITFGASLLECGLMLFLMRADARASVARATAYHEVV